MSKLALQRAVESVGNSQTKLAEKIGTTQSMVWYWLTRAKKGVPAEFVLKIEAATDGKVTRHELRPDIFPPSQQGTAA